MITIIHVCTFPRYNTVKHLTIFFSYQFSVVEVIKQIEPGSMMPTAKPRLQGEVYSPKSCDPGRDEGNCATGLCSTFGLFGRGGLLTIELLAFNRCIFQSCYLFYLNIQHFRSKLNLPILKKSIKFFYPTILFMI